MLAEFFSFFVLVWQGIPWKTITTDGHMIRILCLSVVLALGGSCECRTFVNFSSAFHEWWLSVYCRFFIKNVVFLMWWGWAFSFFLCDCLTSLPRFILGFFIASVPWYVGAFVFFCLSYDPRESTGLTACAIAVLVWPCYKYFLWVWYESAFNRILRLVCSEDNVWHELEDVN